MYIHVHKYTHNFAWRKKQQLEVKHPSYMLNESDMYKYINLNEISLNKVDVF